MKTPWLTVILPVYNASKYLSNCLDSIIHQSFSDLEIIVIDDGSTDKSLNIINEFADRDDRIMVITQSNKGPLFSRCRAVEHAHGKYILFCDADDCYVENAFLTLHQLVKDTQYDLVQFNYYVKYNHVKLLGKKTKYNKLVISEKEFRCNDYPRLFDAFVSKSRLSPNVWSKLYNRKLLSNLPPKELRDTMFLGDDYVLNLWLLQDCQSVLYIDNPLYVYRASSGYSKRFKESSIYDINNIKKHQFFLFERYDEDNRNQVYAYICHVMACCLLHHIKRCYKFLGEEITKKKIKDLLSLSSVTRARDYFKSHLDHKDMPDMWLLPCELLLKGDVDQYLYVAKTYKAPTPLRQKIMTVVRWIIQKI